MTLYLYNKNTKEIVQEMTNVESYTADQIVGEDGAIYAPLADWVELSGKADCSEALREAWRAANPTAEQRMEELEALMAALLFGGKPV